MVDSGYGNNTGNARDYGNTITAGDTSPSSLSSINIDRISLKNNFYRDVILTSPSLQVVVMKITDYIPREVHRKSDQLFYVKKGKLLIGYGTRTKELGESVLEKGDMLLIPRGTYHAVINIGDIPSKIVTIYSPPHHPPKKRQFYLR